MTRSRAASACLFGGALFAAGLSAELARADRMAHTSVLGYFRANPTDAPFPLEVQRTSDGPLGIAPISYASQDFNVSAVCTNTEIAWVHEREDEVAFSYSTVALQANFFALGSAPIEISWDFGDWDFAYGVLVDVISATTLVNLGTTNSGSWTGTLVDGRPYRFVSINSGSLAGGDAFATLRIVEPCAADLNGDGILNVDDIDAFVASFLGGCP